MPPGRSQHAERDDRDDRGDGRHQRPAPRRRRGRTEFLQEARHAGRALIAFQRQRALERAPWPASQTGRARRLHADAARLQRGHAL
jgi:hypothetical protein